LRTAASVAVISLLLAARGANAAEGDAAIAAYLEAWNGAPGRLAAALDPGFTDRTMLLPVDAAMLAGHIDGWRAAIPNLKVTLLERASAPGLALLRLRFEGQPADPHVLLPLTGGMLHIEQSERLSMKNGRIASRQATVDDWTVPPELLFVAPASSPFEPHRVEPVAELGASVFLESIVAAPDGTLYVSTGLDGGIVRIDENGAVKPFAAVDVGAGGFMMCLALGSDGVLYATVNSRKPDVLGIWRFDRSGRGVRIAALPEGATPNGIALDGRGNALAADSFGGVIWRVPLAGGAPEVWLRDSRLLPRPLVGRFPGANGLQRAGATVFVAVSDRSLLLGIPILDDVKAGEPRIVSSTLAGDDFAVAADGTIYVTTHPFNTLVRLSPGGRQTVIAGPAQGVVGPTAAAIGADGALYVANDGGLFRPLPGVEPRASVVRVRIAPAE
jgi:hypothetical protein